MLTRCAKISSTARLTREYHHQSRSIMKLSTLKKQSRHLRQWASRWIYNPRLFSEVTSHKALIHSQHLIQVRMPHRYRHLQLWEKQAIRATKGCKILLKHWLQPCSLPLRLQAKLSQRSRRTCSIRLVLWWARRRINLRLLTLRIKQIRDNRQLMQMQMMSSCPFPVVRNKARPSNWVQGVSNRVVVAINNRREVPGTTSSVSCSRPTTKSRWAHQRTSMRRSSSNRTPSWKKSWRQLS